MGCQMWWAGHEKRRRCSQWVANVMSQTWKEKKMNYRKVQLSWGWRTSALLRDWSAPWWSPRADFAAPKALYMSQINNRDLLHLLTKENCTSSWILYQCHQRQSQQLLYIQLWNFLQPGSQNCLQAGWFLSFLSLMLWSSSWICKVWKFQTRESRNI